MPFTKDTDDDHLTSNDVNKIIVIFTQYLLLTENVMF